LFKLAEEDGAAEPAAAPRDAARWYNRSAYGSETIVLLFEFFPAFVMIVSLVVGVWLYVANRSAPDESAEDEKRRREVAARAASATAKGTAAERGRSRPSMSA
jgi:hypothetical protein